MTPQQAADTTKAETIARGRQALENLRLAGRTSYELKQWCDQVAAALAVLENAAKETT